VWEDPRVTTSGNEPPSGQQPDPDQPAWGQPPADSPYGQPPAQPPYGQPPYGQQPYGQPVYGAPGVDPAAPYGRSPLTGEPFSDKSKLVAGLLQIFIGGFGIGRFYTGYTGIAIAQIIVTLITCGLGAIWGLIDGIIILTSKDFRDAQGRLLRD
jgi:hypothetical protein